LGFRYSFDIRHWCFVILLLIIRHLSWASILLLAQQNLFGFVLDMAQTQLTWYGQSAFRINTPGGNVLLIDPWLTNPVFDKGR